MSFKTRFLIVALFNSGLLFGLLFLFSQNASATQRLVDLNLENAADFRTFSYFVGALLLGLVVNVVLFSSRKNEYSYDQIRALVSTMKHG